MPEELTTAALTAFFGVLVFVIGQIAVKSFIEPIQEQRRVIGEIAFILTYYGNIEGVLSFLKDDPERWQEVYQEAHQKIRSLAGELRRSLTVIPIYWLLSLFGIVRRKRNIIRVSASLIGWSNSLSDARNTHKKDIQQALNLSR